MKTRLTLSVLACLLFCGQAWAGETLDFPKSPSFKSGTTPPITDGYHIVTPEETRASLIRQWAKEGEICRVLDHQWIYGPKGETHTFKENPPAMWLIHPRLDKDQRYCPVCKTLMMKIKTERWEAVKP